MKSSTPKQVLQAPALACIDRFADWAIEAERQRIARTAEMQCKVAEGVIECIRRKMVSGCSVGDAVKQYRNMMRYREDTPQDQRDATLAVLDEIERRGLANAATPVR